MDRKGKNTFINVGPGAANPEPNNTGVSPEYPTLIVMIAVLAIILLFCFWGAPGVRDYCQRKICCHCPMDEPRESSGTPRDDRSSTPTIILLPFGRMLVVDRNVISQLQADQTGIDFMELGANLIRAHHLRCSSTPSILDSETTSKGLSPISLGFSPPSYEDIFGDKNHDLPPSYSELSLMFRQRQLESSEMQSFNIGTMTARTVSVRETILDMNENEERISETKEDEEESNEETPTTVPFLDLPSLKDATNEDFTYPNCKYCIMSFGSERRAKIKCYEEDEVTKCVPEGSHDAAGACCSNKDPDVVNECSIVVEPETDETCAIAENGGDSGNQKTCEYDLNDLQSCDDTSRRSCEDIRESSL